MSGYSGYWPRSSCYFFYIYLLFIYFFAYLPVVRDGTQQASAQLFKDWRTLYIE